MWKVTIMKVHFHFLMISFALCVLPVLGDDAPRSPIVREKPAESVDINSRVGTRARISNAVDGTKAVRAEAPGSRGRAGNEAAATPASIGTQSFIGVFADPLPEALAAQLGELLGKSKGVHVVDVIAGSPAEKAGIKPHDVLVAYDGTRIASVEQLRELLRADHPGRTAKIDLIRASKEISRHVEVGERIVQRPAVPSDGSTPVPVQMFGRQIIVGRRGVDAPGTVIRWGTPAEVDASESRPSMCSVVVDRRDAASWNVVVTYSGPDGKQNEKRLEGTSGEIRSRLDEFPPTVGDQIRRTLDRAESEKNPKPNVRVNVQPRVQGVDRGLHISIQRPGQAGGPRIFEFDHVFGGEKRVQVGDLLKVQIFSEELQGLAPAVREQVEETLRDVELPEVRVEIRESL